MLNLGLRDNKTGVSGSICQDNPAISLDMTTFGTNIAQFDLMSNNLAALQGAGPYPRPPKPPHKVPVAFLLSEHTPVQPQR
jgi:hypothetical protein